MQMQASPQNKGAIWIKLAVVYLIVGVAMGIMMGASRDFTLRPVHAHINLLGWATFALAGLIYTVYPRAGLSKLAKIHFWLMNISVPVMMAALGIILTTQNMKIIPVLVVAEMLAAASVLVFAANIFLNLKQE
ncbi:hypothetical protein [Pseudoduganella rhizocola]|uniref:hypothetical protein n=1 Tax=Pseudoduganella rhizocola TaxID=3382643 RepID=UPI0038B532EF